MAKTHCFVHYQDNWRFQFRVADAVNSGKLLNSCQRTPSCVKHIKIIWLRQGKHEVGSTGRNREINEMNYWIAFARHFPAFLFINSRSEE